MNTKKEQTWVEVSEDALANNVRVLSELIKDGTKLMAVVKSNAYGHGLIGSARIFVDNGIKWLGVFSFQEALILRNNNIIANILVFGPVDPIDYKEAIKHKISITISRREQILNLLPNLHVHLKVDTGLSRQGVSVGDTERMLKGISEKSYIEGIYTHLADAYNYADKSYSLEQIAKFERALDTASARGYRDILKHVLASCGLILFPEAHLDVVRTGMALYGFLPDETWRTKFDEIGLTPALSFKTIVSEIKEIDKGTNVGYGSTERVKKKTKIATLPVGYWDGYSRGLWGKSDVLINGKRCRVTGRISMNMMMADCTGLDVKAGDICTLIGKDGEDIVSALELAKILDTSSYEIVTKINPLLPRIYLQSDITW